MIRLVVNFNQFMQKYPGTDLSQSEFILNVEGWKVTVEGLEIDDWEFLHKLVENKARISNLISEGLLLVYHNNVTLTYKDVLTFHFDDSTSGGTSYGEAVLDKDLDYPPPLPNEDDKYIVKEGSTGDWFGFDNHIAIFEGGIWKFIDPEDGYKIWVDDEELTYTFNDGEWLSPITFYTKTELDNGQLDNRYYTKTQIDWQMANHSQDASTINLNTSNFKSILDNTDIDVQRALDTVDNSLVEDPDLGIILTLKN